MSEGHGSRFSCVLLQNRSFDEIRTDCALVEDAGFSTVWVADHLMSFPKIGTLLEAWTLLAALAATTTEIRIGTLVTNITYRNPALLAKEVLTVDHISGGRLDVGIGAAGTRPDDARVAGVDEWAVAERAERFDEFVALVDAVLKGTARFDGKYYRTEAFPAGDWNRQRPRPPMMIAAQGPRTLRVAAQYGDSWNGLAGFGRTGEDLLSFLRSCNEQLDEFTVEFGRSGSDVRRSVLVHNSGFEWWSSRDALDDFLGKMREVGIEDFVFYYPPYGESAEAIDGPRFLELIAPVLG